jgi:hypothetical protein
MHAFTKALCSSTYGLKKKKTRSPFLAEDLSLDVLGGKQICFFFHDKTRQVSRPYLIFLTSRRRGVIGNILTAITSDCVLLLISLFYYIMMKFVHSHRR